MLISISFWSANLFAAGSRSDSESSFGRLDILNGCYCMCRSPKLLRLMSESKEKVNSARRRERRRKSPFQRQQRQHFSTFHRWNQAFSFCFVISYSFWYHDRLCWKDLARLSTYEVASDSSVRTLFKPKRHSEKGDEIRLNDCNVLYILWCNVV